MIKFQEQVPAVYPNASRDFQYLCWLINIVLNSVKHNVDDIYDLPNTKADPKLTELLAMTLGFKVKRNYDQKQLTALVAVLPRILKYKGTKTAVDMAGHALIAASGASGSFSSTINGAELQVVLPKDLVDTSLFTDLLPYILPAGMTCYIARKNQIQRSYTTDLSYQDSLIAEWVQDLEWNTETQSASGLASIFDAPATSPNFANYITNAPAVLNVGLADNTIIPAVGTPIGGLEPDYTEIQNNYGTTVILNKYSTKNNDNGTTTVIGKS